MTGEVRIWMELVREPGRGASLLVTIDLPGTRPPAVRELELRSSGWFGVAVGALAEHWIDAMPYGKLAARIPAEYVAAALSGLNDGALLLIGGRAPGSRSGGALASCELLPPRAARWQPVAPLSVGRAGVVVERLGDGSVLCAGGVAADGSGARLIERFDARARTWSDAGELLATREHPTACVLAEGRVLFAGGDACAELWDPATRSSQWVEALGPRTSPMLLMLVT